MVLKYFSKRPYILFILPALMLYSLFIIYPIVATLPYSLTEWGGLGQAQFVGFRNFNNIFTNDTLTPQLWNAIKNTAFLLLLTYLIVNPLVLVVAYFLYRKIFLSDVYKTIIFMPQFVNAVAVSFIVTLFFSPSIGLFSTFMKWIGLEQYAIPAIWEDPAYAIPLVLLVGVWRGVGYEILLYIANYTMVPKELDEAARIDGASETQRFLYIYFPLIAPAFTNVVVLMYIWTLTTFEVPFLLGGLTGGVSGSMDTIQLFFYRTVFGRGSYSSNFIGIGSTISSILLIVLASGSFLLQKFLGRRQIEY